MTSAAELGPRALVETSVTAIRARVPNTPRVGVVLGSGLGAFTDTLEQVVKIPYSEIPHMPVSKVVGHAGNLCFGRVKGVEVVCMQGRVHVYEGHPFSAVVHGARTMAALGVTTVLLTNAAGGVNLSFSAGDLMIVTDHLNLMGQTPLLGANDDKLGPRFPDMTQAYDGGLREALAAIGKREGIALQTGVYAGLLGPSYETPAEIRMLRTLGADAVGMSTVPETIALRHMGVRVGALSCVTNMGSGISGQKLDHAEVEETARKRKADLAKLLAAWIEVAEAK